MKFIFLLFSLFILVSCGNDKLTSNQSQSSSGLSGNTGTLSLPAPGLAGGSITLSYGSSNLMMGTLSQEASSYLNALYSGQINVRPISQDYYSTKYRVHFSGTPTQGRCPFNPTAQCPVINLQTLQAY